jgi:hypothetical protein
VKTLLNANTDKRLRDYKGRCAIDLAQPVYKKKKKKYRRFFYIAAESVPERDRDRRYIVVLFGDSNAEKQHRYTKLFLKNKYNKYDFRKS